MLHQTGNVGNLTVTLRSLNTDTAASIDQTDAAGNYTTSARSRSAR
ncbi:MAG: hypothetical protein QM736_02975 [Vicinamibacterales bacterium]